MGPPPVSRGRGPVPGFGACSKRGVFWSPGEPGRDSPEGSPGPCGPRGPRDGDRAPARGVDVKPRTRDRLSPGTGVPRPPQAPEGPPDQVRDQDPGSREPGSSSPPGTRRLREAPEAPLARPGPPGGGCFTSTPPAGRAETAKKARKPRFRGIPAKKAFFRHFGQKWLFLAILPKKCPVATGLKPPNLAKNGQNP